MHSSTYVEIRTHNLKIIGTTGSHCETHDTPTAGGQRFSQHERHPLSPEGDDVPEGFRIFARIPHCPILLQTRTDCPN